MIDSALAAEAAVSQSAAPSLIHGPREMYPFGQVADVDGQKRSKSTSTRPGNGERVITGETMACGMVQCIRMPTLGRKEEDGKTATIRLFP